MRRKRIVWFANKTKPVGAQMRELERLFPGHVLVVDNTLWDGDHLEDVLTKFKEYGGDEMVCVMPLNFLYSLVKLGAQPLKSKMKLAAEVNNRDPRILEHGHDWISKSGSTVRLWKFDGFVRVTDMSITEEEIVAEV